MLIAPFSGQRCQMRLYFMYVGICVIGATELGGESTLAEKGLVKIREVLPIPERAEVKGERIACGKREERPKQKYEGPAVDGDVRRTRDSRCSAARERKKTRGEEKREQDLRRRRKKHSRKCNGICTPLPPLHRAVP